MRRRTGDRWRIASDSRLLVGFGILSVEIAPALAFLRPPQVGELQIQQIHRRSSRLAMGVPDETARRPKD